MKAVVFALSILGVGCGGECVPSTAKSPASFAVVGTPAPTVAVARSADELRAALAGVRMSPPPQSPGAAPTDDAERLRSVTAQLDAFVTGTSFATTDVALVRAGTDRQRLAGVTTDGDRTTLYFTNQCSPCPGGNPGSYYEAAAADQWARAERTELVRVPKNAHVDVRTCSASCGGCSTNVP